jgi:hypothetical protein
MLPKSTGLQKWVRNKDGERVYTELQANNPSGDLESRA